MITYRCFDYQAENKKGDGEKGALKGHEELRRSGARNSERSDSYPYVKNSTKSKLSIHGNDVDDEAESNENERLLPGTENVDYKAINDPADETK